MRPPSILTACLSASLLSACGEEASTPALDDLEAVTQPLESADLWNYPNDNFFRCVCVYLKNPSAPLRHEDFSLIV